jgi:transposase
MTSHLNLDQLNPEELRALAAQLIQRIETMDKQITHHKSVNEKLAHEIALLKRFKFAKRSEQLSPDQASLLDDLIDTDIAAIEAELEALQPAAVEAKVRQQPKRAALPSQFPRTLIHHKPENSHCQCGCALKRIGEDASEKLDYTPGVFMVERHIRGKWACEQCETLIQAPVPAHVIDKGIPTAGLLAHVMVAKFADHLPLYRQEKISGRAGLPIARSTLAQWVGSCGVQLQPLVPDVTYPLSDSPQHGEPAGASSLRSDQKQPGTLTPSAALAAVCFLKEVILPTGGLVFQHTQFLELLRVDIGALWHHGEIDFRIGDDFLNQWQGQLRLLHADIGLGRRRLIGLDNFLGLGQRRVKRLVGFRVFVVEFLSGVQHVKRGLAT